LKNTAVHGCPFRVGEALLGIATEGTLYGHMTQTYFRGLGGKYEALIVARRKDLMATVRGKRRKLPSWPKTALSYKKRVRQR